MPAALTREKVVRTALRLLDKVGLDGLTLRKLTAELRVQAPALYWYFNNSRSCSTKRRPACSQELSRRCCRGNRGIGRTGSCTWVTESGGCCCATATARQMYSGTYLTNRGLYLPIEAALRRLVEAGFTARNAICVYRTIYCYAVGLTIEVAGGLPAAGQAGPNVRLKATGGADDPGPTVSIDARSQRGGVRFRPAIPARFAAHRARLAPVWPACYDQRLST